MAAPPHTASAIVVGVVLALAVVVAVRSVERVNSRIPPLVTAASDRGVYRGTTDQDQLIEVTVGTSGVTIRYDVIVSCDPGGTVTRGAAFDAVALRGGAFDATKGNTTTPELASVKGVIEGDAASGEIRESLKGTPSPASVCSVPNDVIHWTATRQ